MIKMKQIGSRKRDIWRWEGGCGNKRFAKVSSIKKVEMRREQQWIEVKWNRDGWWNANSNGGMEDDDDNNDENSEIVV